jgi:hypothetical protein
VRFTGAGASVTRVFITLEKFGPRRPASAKVRV